MEQKDADRLYKVMTTQHVCGMLATNRDVTFKMEDGTLVKIGMGGEYDETYFYTDISEPGAVTPGIFKFGSI